jgi:polyisoprenoid-binding protein YceI
MDDLAHLLRLYCASTFVFNAANHNQLLFTSTKYEGDEQKGKLYGDLTILGITKSIILNIEPGGIVVDSYGQTKAGFTVNGKISRREFGLT